MRVQVMGVVRLSLTRYLLTSDCLGLPHGPLIVEHDDRDDHDENGRLINKKTDEDRQRDQGKRRRCETLRDDFLVFLKHR